MKRMLKKVKLDFETAFKYPFNRAKGMFNILWLLLPIFGWFALFGYNVRIVQEFCRGRFERLPVMDFGDDMKFGFFMFLKAIPFVLAYIVAVIILSVFGVFGEVVMLFVELLIIPVLAINFMNKETVASFFEFDIVSSVFGNLGDYLIAILKSIGLAIVFILMTIILVGIPAAIFTQNIFLADFYRRNVK